MRSTNGRLFAWPLLAIGFAPSAPAAAQQGSGELPPPPPTGTVDPAAPSPSVVVDPPYPPVMIIQPPAPPPYEYVPPPPDDAFLHRPEWGLNLHLEDVAIGLGTGDDAMMGGVGLGFRWKANRYFGVETDVDFLDLDRNHGESRTEAAVALNGLVFLNPRSRAQCYLLAGIGWWGAHLTSNAPSIDERHDFFGGQVGAGVEYRLSDHVALDADLRGYIRSRTDDLTQTQPEFTSADGRTTNTEGGALFTAGVTIYF